MSPDYTFEVPAGESNAQPDWSKAPSVLPDGETTATLEATLIEAELRLLEKTNNLAVLAEFKVAAPHEEDPVEHSEWMTVLRNGKRHKMTPYEVSRIAVLTGLSPQQVQVGMEYTSNHDKFNEVLSRRCGAVFRLTFVRKAGSQYTNITKIEELA